MSLSYIAMLTAFYVDNGPHPSPGPVANRRVLASTHRAFGGSQTREGIGADPDRRPAAVASRSLLAHV